MTEEDERIDALYISRPQVERWPDELLERYADSLPSAKKELERRRKVLPKEEEKQDEE